MSNEVEQLTVTLLREVKEEIKGFREDARRLEGRINTLENALAIQNAVNEVIDIKSLSQRITSLEKWKYGVIMLSGVLGGIFGFVAKLLF